MKRQVWMMMAHEIDQARRQSRGIYGPGGSGPIWLAVLLLFLLAGCVRHTFLGTEYDPPKQLNDVQAVNWDGEPFLLSAHQGKVLLLFFGYTYCPDICPLTMTQMNRVYDQLGNRRDGVEVLFITVDPQRDSVDRLAAYIPVFNPDFYGLYIEDAADLGQVKVDFGVFAEPEPVPAGGNPESYLVAHTGYLYVVDKAGNLRLTYPQDTPVEDLVADIKVLLKE